MLTHEAGEVFGDIGRDLTERRVRQYLEPAPNKVRFVETVSTVRNQPGEQVDHMLREGFQRLRRIKLRQQALQLLVLPPLDHREVRTFPY